MELLTKDVLGVIVGFCDFDSKCALSRTCGTLRQKIFNGLTFKEFFLKHYPSCAYYGQFYLSCEVVKFCSRKEQNSKEYQLFRKIAEGDTEVNLDFGTGTMKHLLIALLFESYVVLENYMRQKNAVNGQVLAVIIYFLKFEKTNSSLLDAIYFVLWKEKSYLTSDMIEKVIRKGFDYLNRNIFDHLPLSESIFNRQMSILMERFKEFCGHGNVP